MKKVRKLLDLSPTCIKTLSIEAIKAQKDGERANFKQYAQELLEKWAREIGDIR